MFDFIAASRKKIVNSFAETNQSQNLINFFNRSIKKSSKDFKISISENFFSNIKGFKQGLKQSSLVENYLADRHLANTV